MAANDRPQLSLIRATPDATLPGVVLAPRAPPRDSVSRSAVLLLPALMNGRRLLVATDGVGNILAMEPSDNPEATGDPSGEQTGRLWSLVERARVTLTIEAP